MPIMIPSITVTRAEIPQIDRGYILSSRRQQTEVAGCRVIEVERVLAHLRSAFGEEVIALPLPLLERDQVFEADMGQASFGVFALSGGAGIGAGCRKRRCLSLTGGGVISTLSGKS